MKKLATSLLLLFVSTLAVKAVEPDKTPLASINEKMVITLPASVPLAEAYIIDVTAINFKDESVLNGFCASFSENHMTLTGDFAAKKITLSLHSTDDVAGEEWDINQWNTYLNSRAPKMLAYINSLNK